MKPGIVYAILGVVILSLIVVVAVASNKKKSQPPAQPKKSPAPDIYKQLYDEKKAQEAMKQHRKSQALDTIFSVAKSGAQVASAVAKIAAKAAGSPV